MDERDLVVVEESDKTLVEIVEDGDTRSVVVDSESISIVTAQVQGPPGVGADKHYHQSFTVANSVVVNHNLNKKPAVTVIDSTGAEVVIDVDHTNDNQLVASWTGLFSGDIFCN